MKKKIIILLIVAFTILGVIIFILFSKNDYKILNLGNNISINSVKDRVLQLESYEARVTVTINSNKNTNTYELMQQYVKPNLCRQEVVKPENIKGLVLNYNGTDLKVENTTLQLSKIYHNYPYIAENNLMLNAFIEEYLNNESADYENGVFYIEDSKASPYMVYKKLYVDEKTGLPIKLEIEDKNKNNQVYILYNEIKLNSKLEGDVFL